MTEDEIKKFCKDIDNDKIHVRKIKQIINSGEIGKENLLKHSVEIDDTLLTKILNFQDLSIDYNDWGDLPALERNRTDLYFFGQPSSGKTCILASLFNYAYSKGLIKDNQHNRNGSRYRDTLINGINNGVLPQGTPKDGVNYVPIDLKNPNNGRIHPLNFIEMSGEKFLDFYRDGETEEISSKRYLKNDNRKLLFFVFDYQTFNNKDEQAISAQTNQLQNVLTLLSNDGTLNKTDSIFLLLSKSDKFPKGKDQVEHASSFVEEKMKNLKFNLKEIQSLHNNDFNIILFPYTIGEVKLKGILDKKNISSSKNLINWICEKSFSEERNWWKKFIGIK